MANIYEFDFEQGVPAELDETSPWVKELITFLGLKNLQFHFVEQFVVDGKLKDVLLIVTPDEYEAIVWREGELFSCLLPIASGKQQLNDLSFDEVSDTLKTHLHSSFYGNWAKQLSTKYVYFVSFMAEVRFMWFWTRFVFDRIEVPFNKEINSTEMLERLEQLGVRQSQRLQANRRFSRVTVLSYQLLRIEYDYPPQDE